MKIEILQPLLLLAVTLLLSGSGLFAATRSNRDKNYFFLITMFLIFSCMIGLKSDATGNDTGAYTNIYYSLQSGSPIQEFTDRFELGFLLFVKLIVDLRLDVQFMFVFSGLYVCIAYASFIAKYSKMFWLSVFLFITLGNFDNSMSGLRDSMCIATLLFGYTFVRERKPVKFLLMVLLAAQFHTVGYCFIIAYPLYTIRLTKRLVVWAMVAALAVFFAISSLINIAVSLFPRYEYYTLEAGSTYLDGVTRIASILETCVSAVVVITIILFRQRKLSYIQVNGGKLEITSPNAEVGREHIYVFVALLLSFISIKGTILSRFADIFDVFTITYLPNFYSLIENRQLKFVLIVCTVVAFGAYYIIVKIVRPEWSSTFPYSFFWQS